MIDPYLTIGLFVWKITDPILNEKESKSRILCGVELGLRDIKSLIEERTYTLYLDFWDQWKTGKT